MPPLNSVPPLAPVPAQALADFLKGVQRYRHSPLQTLLVPPPTLMQWGTTRLLDYGVFCPAPDPLPILVIPSLINRAYILDLHEKGSFLRWLAGQGYRPLLVDWQEPGSAEQDFTLTDYITQRLEPALSTACQMTSRAVPVLGYCMGGLMALALAQRRLRDAGALILLATPWDFHAASTSLQRHHLAQVHPAIVTLCQHHTCLYPDVLQYLLLGTDPFSVVERFRQLGEQNDSNDHNLAHFIAIEDWLNDGVPLARAVALECLFDWYRDNSPARNQWRIAGHPVVPERITSPTLIVAATRDRLVPPASSHTLATLLPRASILSPDAGHVGMVAGRNAGGVLWEPLKGWLAQSQP